LNKILGRRGTGVDQLFGVENTDKYIHQKVDKIELDK